MNMMTKGPKEGDYKTILDTVPDIIYEVDNSGRFTFLSESARILGYEPSELIKKHFRTIIHPDDIDRVSRIVILPKYRGRRTGDEGSPKLFDERRTASRMTRGLVVRLVPKQKNGGPIYFKISSSGKWEEPAGRGERRLVGSIGIMRDITKEIELDKLKEEFVSIISHELRAPLTIMKESSSLLVEGVAGRISEKQKKILTANMDGIERLLRIVNGLLDVARIEAGKEDLYKEKVEVASLFETLEASFADAIRSKGLDFKVRAPAGSSVYADKDRLMQVLVNLLSNAFKFTRKGSVELLAAVSGDNMAFQVKDTGVGVPLARQKDIFTKFSELKYARDMGEKGTGLGLSIAKGIVEMHGGSISIESSEGKGTAFTFYLPRYSVEAVYKDKVGRALKDAMRAGTKVSFVTVEFATDGKLMLKAVEEIRKNLQREGDNCFVVERSAIIVLPNCSEDGVSKVCDRLKSVLSAMSSVGKIKFRLKRASYPSDAEELEGVLRKL